MVVFVINGMNAEERGTCVMLAYSHLPPLVLFLPFILLLTYVISLQFPVVVYGQVFQIHFFNKLIYFIYFIFGCVGSSLLRVGSL